MALGVSREPLGLENLLARQQALGIGVEALDEVFARGQLIEARAQTGEDRASLRPTGGRELEQPRGPGEQAVHMHKARLGAHGGRRQTRQEGVLELARDATTGRQTTLEGRVVLVRALEQAGGGMRDIVDARAAQALCGQQVDGFVPVAATVFEGGRGAAHLRDEPLEECGNRLAGPGIAHRDPKAVHARHRGGSVAEMMVMGIDGHDDSYLARAQANTEIDHPDQAVAEGRLVQGHTPQETSGLQADHGEADDPGDDGVRTRCSLDAKGQRQESEDARDRTKANASDSKELQSQGDHIDLGPGGESVQLGLKETQAGLRLFEGLSGPLSLGSEARILLTLVALSLASLRGLVFPLISTVCHFGQWAHHVSSEQRDGPRPWNGCEVGMKMSR